MRGVNIGPIYARSDPRIMPPNPEPRVLITAELLELFDRWPGDDARLERGEDRRIVGSVLRLHYKGVRTVYCIRGVAEHGDASRGNTYLAEWPD